MTLRTGELIAPERRDAISIADLYGRVEAALAREFPRADELWVRGEILHVSDQAGRGGGHLYFDLVDPDAARQRTAPVLKVKCWQSTWGPLRATLRRAGVTLAPGMVVFIRGAVNFYAPKAEVGFVLAELDVSALLGRMAAQRAALVRALGEEGLLGRNGALPVPEVPLRLGLVASPGTEGYRDFLGQLSGSGFGFSVTVAPTVVQGADAPASIARALRSLSSLGPGVLDLVVVVRGGGSKADLAAFDAEPVARAVATASVPVWTGIGHTGDESVADIVANRACITPTECGRELAGRVGSFWAERVARAGVAVAGRCVDALDMSEGAHDACRRRLVSMAHHLLARRAELLGARGDHLVRRAPRALEEARTSLVTAGARLGPLVAGHVERADDRIGSWRRRAAAYDVERQLERGYTLTLDARGAVVRSAGALGRGDVLTTRFFDGSVESVVASVSAPTGRGTDEEKEEG